MYSSSRTETDKIQIHVDNVCQMAYCSVTWNVDESAPENC